MICNVCADLQFHFFHKVMDQWKNKLIKSYQNLLWFSNGIYEEHESRCMNMQFCTIFKLKLRLIKLLVQSNWWTYSMILQNDWLKTSLVWIRRCTNEMKIQLHFWTWDKSQTKLGHTYSHKHGCAVLLHFQTWVEDWQNLSHQNGS